MALARRLNDSLYSGHNQFGFELDHGTELCVFSFKELLRFYVEHGSAMHMYTRARMRDKFLLYSMCGTVN